MSLDQLTDQHQQVRQMHARTTSAQLMQLWRDRVDPERVHRTWQEAIPQASELITEMQARAAVDAEEYMTASLLDAGMEPQGPRIQPAGFSGFSYPEGDAPPRVIEEALAYPAYKSLDTLRRGGSMSRSKAAGLDSLVTLGASAVADAGRQADGAITATEPQVSGYVRQIEPGACARCVILAGRRYRRNEGFSRHPNCLCTHKPIIDGQPAPAAQDSYAMFNDLSSADQDRIFTKSGAQAIRDGADMNQVVNARRGMSRTSGGSLITDEGMAQTRSGRFRGAAGRIMQRNNVEGARMMPEEIYRRAGGDQALITEQLERYGYILPGGQDSDGVLAPERSGWYGPAAGYWRDAGGMGTATLEGALESERQGRYRWNPNR